MSVTIQGQRIAYPDNPIMAAAWLSCVRWAWDEPTIRAAFEADTGSTYRPAANSLDAAIDRATGHLEATANAFVDWINTHVWGEDPFSDEPEAAQP